MKSKDLNILYEDSAILVCFKPHGLATQSRSISTPDLESLLKAHLSKSGAGGKAPYLAVIHRLDQPVSGILVFAKTPAAAKELNRQLTKSGFGKYYEAITDGIPTQKDGILRDYLVKNGATNLSSVCKKGTPNAKEARLSYKVLEEYPETNQALLSVTLDTGRHHQIRVQLAHMGCPINGDRKYNPNSTAHANGPLKLAACRLAFQHPTTKKNMEFRLPEPVFSLK